MSDERPLKEREFEFEGKVYRFKRPTVGVVNAVDKIKTDIVGEVPAIIKRTPKVDADLDVWGDYAEAQGEYNQGYFKRLIENWPRYVAAMVEDPKGLDDPNELTPAEMQGIAQNFTSAAGNSTRIHFAALTSSPGSGTPSPLLS